MKKAIKIDKDTIDSIRSFDNEIRLQQIKEDLDRLIGGDIYSGDLTDEQIAKLDYMMCEIEVLINKNKGIIVQIEEC